MKSAIATVVLQLSIIFAIVDTLSSHKFAARLYCPPDFVRINQRCYFFSKEIKNDWDDAGNQCGKLDPRAQLINIETEREWKSITTYLQEEGLDADKWWIGATNRDNKAIWMWMGSNQPISINAWCPYQPNNYLNNENCAHILKLGGSICVNDLKCRGNTSGYRLRYICEYD